MKYRLGKTILGGSILLDKWYKVKVIDFENNGVWIERKTCKNKLFTVKCNSFGCEECEANEDYNFLEFGSEINGRKI